MKVGKKRIAVLIGQQGETKKEIENTLGVKINLDSKTGECEVIQNINSPNYNPINVFTAQKIINAINRGFAPVKALKLMEETYDLVVFNLLSIIGRADKRIKTIKGRIIGRNGEIRKALERYAESFVSVYGKTVSIIADYENLQIARKAVSMIINGMPHHVVLKFLENKYNEKKRNQFKQFYKPEF